MYLYTSKSSSDSTLSPTQEREVAEPVKSASFEIYIRVTMSTVKLARYKSKKKTLMPFPNALSTSALKMKSSKPSHKRSSPTYALLSNSLKKAAVLIRGQKSEITKAVA